MKAQKDFFNRVADSWDQRSQHDMNKVEAILDMTQIAEGSRVLDVGTGTGVLVPSLSERVSSAGYVKAVDVAERMIEIAKKKNRFGNVLFACEDALAPAQDEAPFDYVICYSMFPHFKDKKWAVERLAQKIRVGGKLVIGHSQSREAINSLHRRADQAVSEDHLPPMKILREYFQVGGLRVLAEIDNQDMFVIVGEKTDG